jgi:phage-related minor tail protein
VALTVGELNAIITIDDRAVDPALRRTEQALRRTGQQLGDDADRAGQQAGQQLGGGFIRGADGQWRNMRGELVDEVTAATLEAEAAARRGGQQAGQALGDGLTDGAGDGADDAVAESESRLSKLKTVALGVGAAAGAVLMEAFGQAMEENQITAKLGASMGKTPAEAQRYGHIAGQLWANAVTEDFQTAADTIGAVMAAGLTPPEATNAQIQSIAANLHDLSDTFELDLGQAANAVGQIMKTGLAPNAKVALDVMTRGMQVMGPRADDLADTFNEYSTIFRQMGISATDATGLLAQGMQAGARDTDVVADSLKEFVLIAQGGGETVDAAFKSIGLNGKEMQKAFVEGGPQARKALDQVFDGLRNMKDPVERNATALALFGTKSEDTQKALLALDPSHAKDALGQVGGAADKMGDSLRDNAASKVTAFKNTMQQELVEFLGTQVIPRLEGFFNFARNNAPLMIGLAAAVTALGAAFSIAAVGVWAMNSAMLANPIFWIIAGIAAAVAGIVILIVTYWDDIKSATETAWSWVVDKVRGAKDALIAQVLFLAQIPGWIATWFNQAKDWAIQKLTALVNWAQGLPGRISSAIAGLQGILITAATRFFQGFRDAAVQRALSLVTWMTGMGGRIRAAVGGLGSILTSAGRNVVIGLWNGIQSMGSWIYNRLIGWAKSMIPGPIAKALGIASPSKVTKAQGRWIARGLIDGLTGSSKQVKSAATKLADIVADSMKPGKKRSKALGRISADSKRLMQLASAEGRLATRMKAAQKKLADLMKARDKLAADVRKGVLDSANITQQDTGGWPQTAESILAGLKADTAAAQTFAKNLAILRKKGVRADLVAQIAEAGVEGGSSAAAALANANAGQIKQINAQQSQLVSAANAAGTTAGNAMYGAGIQAANGLVAGLKKKQSAIEKQMLKIAEGMSKAIRKALGIKSPSKVMARVGAYTAQGLVKGLDGERRAVNRSMASLVDTPAPGSFDMAGSRARAAGSQRVVLELRSSGRAEDDYLMGRMRRSIRKVGGADVDFALTGRRSG